LPAVLVGVDLRADAARDRAAVVEAAGAVFAERGLDASLDEIVATDAPSHRSGHRCHVPQENPCSSL
jgi:hypothetical protein